MHKICAQVVVVGGPFGLDHDRGRLGAGGRDHSSLGGWPLIGAPSSPQILYFPTPLEREFSGTFRAANLIGDNAVTFIHGAPYAWTLAHLSEHSH